MYNLNTCDFKQVMASYQPTPFTPIPLHRNATVGKVLSFLFQVFVVLCFAAIVITGFLVVSYIEKGL